MFAQTKKNKAREHNIPGNVRNLKCTRIIEKLTDICRDGSALVFGPGISLRPALYVSYMHH